jgi:hypothetical protein
LKILKLAAEEGETPVDEALRELLERKAEHLPRMQVSCPAGQSARWRPARHRPSIPECRPSPEYPGMPLLITVSE